MAHWRWVLAAVLLAGCIEEGGSPAPDDNEGDAGRGADGAGGEPGEQPDGGDAPPRRADASVVPDAGERPADAAPPPLSPEQLCDAYCDRVDDCLVPACPALAGGGDMLCRGGCRQPPEALREAVGLECGAFNERLFRAVPQLRDFCSDAPPPPECPGICEHAAECGAPGGVDQCLGVCRTVPPAVRRCAATADSCPALGACFEGGMQPPSDAERCEAYCNRQAICVFRECAAGTLPDGFVPECRQGCEAAPPSPAEMATVFGALCAEVVEDVRDQDPRIDARCDAEPEDVCASVCAETIIPCSDLDEAGCAAVCAGFNAANLACLQFAQACGDVRACYGDAAGQARCDAFCGRLQGCLEEACPPRIIPPELSVSCTAGCLNQPPTAEQLADWEAATCAEVRQFVYRNNRELAPICEGDRDFRPGPEECAAFCDNGLQACIGVGGRHFCLAACASLTRGQYQCALEARGDCDAIAACLADSAP